MLRMNLRGRGGAWRRGGLLALAFAVLIGGWAVLAPAPADADGNFAGRPFPPTNVTVTAQLGATSYGWNSYDASFRPNVCDHTVGAYAANGGWNLATFRLGSSAACEKHRNNPSVNPLYGYELKITSTDSNAHGTANVIPGADIEFVSFAGNGCNLNWPNAAGQTYNRMYQFGTNSNRFGGHCNNPANTPRVNFRFSIPPSHTGDIWVHFTGWSNASNHVHARAKYTPPTYAAVHALAAPQDSAGTITATDVSQAQRRPSGGTRQRAAVFLRAAAHSNTYSASGTNVARSLFSSATIKVASDPAGANRIANATISNSSGAKLTACTEPTPGNLCTVTSANWPAGSQADPVTTQLDIWFTVFTAHTGPVYLVVDTVNSSNQAGYRFALPYYPLVAAWPLAAPQDSSGTVSTETLSSTMRSWADSGASQRARIFYRDQVRIAYDATHTSPVASVVSSTTITIASDTAGANPISGAVISSDSAGANKVTNCSEAAAGNTCTVASFPKEAGATGRTTNLDIYFSVPASHSGAAYLVVTGHGTSRLPRSYALRYTPPPAAYYPLIAPAPGGVVAAGRVVFGEPYAEGGASQQAAVFIRDGNHNGEYDTTDPDFAKADFDSATITVTSDVNGTTPITGAEISSDAAGNTAVSACDENTPGNTCTIQSANWPGTTTADRLDLWFSVPASHTGSAYLHITVAASGETPAVFALAFSDTVDAHPLAVPSGTSDGTNLSAGSRNWATGGATQEAAIHVRAAAHSGTYRATAANAERGDFGSTVIVIASDEEGANPISGAEISSDAAGNTAITACTEGSVGHTCTIASGSWPQATTGTPLRTLAQDIHFSVPGGHLGSTYLVVTTSETGSASRRFSLEYGSSEASALPLAVPADPATGAITAYWTGRDLGNFSPTWRPAHLTGTTRAKVFLRDGPHSDTYTAAETNVARSAFNSVRIRAATSATGATEFSGIELIASDGVDGTSVCTEQTAGPTCTIPSSSWPIESGLTKALDIRFAEPGTTNASIFLHVTVNEAGKTARTFSVEFTRLSIAAHPLAVPVTGGSPDTGVIGSGVRSFLESGARQQVRVALRDVWHGDEWDASDANAERSDFGSGATITIGTKNASGVFSALANAAIYNASTGTTALAPCTESTAGNLCTITSANWPQDSGSPARTQAINFWFTVPTATTTPVYVRLRAASSTANSERIYDLKYEPFLRIYPLLTPVPGGIRETGNVKTGSRNYQPVPSNVTQAEVRLHSSAHGDTFSNTGTTVARSAFDSVELRLATAEDGTTSASGPVFTSSQGGSTTLTGCDESAPGPVCTIQSSSWPQTTGGTPLTQVATIYFTVPHDFDDSVWLVARVKKANRDDRVYSVRYDVPYAAYPLVVPAGTADDTDLGAGSRNFLPAGGSQQVTVYLRDAWHDDTYDTSDTNVATSGVAGVTLTISSTDGSTGVASAITSATISANSAGTTAVTGCTGTPNSCTIPIASWPSTSGTTDGLSFYFSVPNTISTPVYVYANAIAPGGSSKSARSVGLRYQPPLAVFPLAVPLGAADAHESGTLTSRTGSYAASAGRQKARVYLRSAWHDNEYDSSDSNAATTEFTGVTIRVATSSDGATAVSGAAITNASGGQLSQCAAAGATCAITTANWPASSGNAQPLDIWFSLPDSFRATAYLHVTVRNAAGYTQTFAAPYESPYIQAYPLIVPHDGSNYETGTLSTNTRTWLPEEGVHRLGLFLRDQVRTSYELLHGNAASSTYDGLTMKITSDAAGNNLIANAAFTGSTGAPLTACTMPSSTPNDCTATTPATIYFTIPDAHTGDVYVHLSVNKAGKLDRATSLKWDAPSTVDAHPLARPQNASGTVISAAGEYDREGGADRARISIRAAASGSTGATVANFDRVVITAASNADGSTAVANAVISSDGAASNPTALTGCTEGSTAGNKCTIPAASWPDTSGVANDLDIYLRLPLSQTGAVYIVVRVESDGERPRVFALKYDPYLRVWPLLAPAPSSTPETGNVKTATRDWAASAAANQAQVFLRDDRHSNTFTASETNVARAAFDRVILRLATAEDGNTSASGPVFTGSLGGSSVLGLCSETSQGPVCTVPATAWPQSGSPPLTTFQNVYFTVPTTHGAVWLVATVQESGKADRVFSVRYDSPYTVYALIVPGGTADGADVTGSRNFLPGAVAQQATVYLRDAWHDDEYNSADTNVATTVVSAVTIAITSNPGGSGTVTGAKISSDSAGTTALTSTTGCNSVDNSCSIAVASWPSTGGTTDGLSFYFSVPNTVSTPVYVVVTPVAAASGKSARGHSLEYDPPLPVFPLAVPLGAADAHETGTLTARTGNFAALGARNKARIYLRDAWHSNAYAATGQDNAPVADFSSVTIRIATSSDGGTAVSGAAITNGSGGRLSQCASAGATCVVNNWPASGGDAQPLDIWFTVPDSRTSNAYLHVTVSDSDGDTQTFVIPYQPPYVSAWPLIVPRPTSTTYETGTLSTNTRRWLPETGVQQISIFLRDQARTSYLSTHGNAASSTYDGLAMKITSDAAGNTLLANATFTTSTGTPATCGNNCTPNLGFPFYFTIPDAHTGAVYIHLSVNKANKLDRATSLRWDPPLTISAHPLATARNVSTGAALPSAGEFNGRAGADRARISLRSSAGGSTNAASTTFDRVVISITSDAAGTTAISGADIASDTSGTQISGCTSNTPPCTIARANWPSGTGGLSGDLDIYLSIPVAYAGNAAYVHVRVENDGERDRTFALKYDAPVGMLSGLAAPQLDPRLSDGTRERDDDGDGDRIDNEHYYGLAAERQRIAVRIYRDAGAVTVWNETVELASFASLSSTAALTLSAAYRTGPLTSTGLNASQIVFTKPDGTALGCSEASYSGGDCTLTRNTLKSLMGIPSAADARRGMEFQFAFAIQTAFTNTGDVIVTASVGRHSGNSSSDKTIVYKRGVTAASNAQPFIRPIGLDGMAETGNVLTSQDPQEHRFRRYRPGGQDTPVHLLIYDSATQVDTYSASTNRVSYSTISEVKIEVKARPTANSLTSGSNIATAQVKVLQNDGTTSACTEASPTHTCTMTAANFLAAGPARAANHYRALPLEFHFSVPAGYLTPNFGNANLVVTVVRTGTGTLAARTKTFTVPFDGGTRAEPFAMVADMTGEARATNQQWAVRGARTPIWAHIYNTPKTAFEAASSSNSALYWEFSETAGATVVKIELLDGTTGTTASSRGLITAAGSDEKFAPCTESGPSNVCSITLAALKAYDTQASPGDTDAVDPLKFAVSIPQGSANSVRLKITVERSDMMTQTGEFHIYAPWAYPLLAPIGTDGRPRTGSLSATVWEYEPRGRPTPLALELYNTRQQTYAAPTSALRPSFADFETVTIRVQDGDGDLITDAELTARNGTPLRGLCPVAASCEITRAEWQARQRGASSPGGLEFAAAVPAAHSAAAVIRIEVAHSGRTAPITAQPVNEQAAPSGPGPVQRIALEESSGVRTAVYELRMVSPVKRAFALPLVPDGEGGLRVCTAAESVSGDDALEACTKPSAQRGAPIGFAAALVRGLEAHPATADWSAKDNDELVEYKEITRLVITAMNAEIIHEALCPRSAAEHPIYQPTAQSDASRCTISSAALQAFQGAAESDAAIRPLQLAYVPGAAAMGRVSLSYEIAGANAGDPIMKTLEFAHVAGPGKRAAGVFLDWSDPGTAYAAGAPAALFAIGRADSRASAAPAPRSALPGRVKTGTFAELAEAKAVELTISQGTIAYDGESCAASAAGCTLSLSRAELMAGAGSSSTADPIGNLRAEYELPLGVAGPTTITLSARFAGEAAAAVGELAIAHPAVSAPVGSAYLPTDADGVIAAGATAEVAAGFTVAVDAAGAGWGCARPDPSFLELNAAGTLLDACAAGLSRLPGGDAPTATAAWLIADSYLAITGPATWSVEGTGDGSKRLMLGGTWNGMRCGLAAEQGQSTAGERDVACWITDAEGNRPSIAIDANAAEDVRITASLIPTRERRFHLFTGPGDQPSDRYADTAAVFRLAGDGNRGSLFRTATIDVGEPAPVAAVELARAGSASGPIPRGGTARLEVRITAAGGAAADAAAIASITLTATRGSLSGIPNTPSADLCPGSARSCTINGGPGTAFTAAVAANPNLPAAVGIDFTPPAGQGSTLISLAVTATGGGQQLFTDSLDLSFAGAASALRASGDRLPLLHHRATADDDRDQIELEVEAEDTAGNAAALPSATDRVLDADGNPVVQGFLIERLCETGASKCKYRVSSTATAAAPLASGRYSLEVDAGQTEAGRRAKATVPFGVAGPADALDPVPAGPPLLGRQLAIQVDVSDAEGNPVADGTKLRVRATAADGPSPLLLANPPSASTDEQSAELTTKDGQATVTFVTVSQGLAIVSFDALDGTRTAASAVHLVDARNAPAPGQPALADPASPAAHLTDGAGRPADPTTTAGLTVWSPPPDATTATAADLLEDLPGTQAIHLWNGRRWIHYATTPQGTPIPGASNFPLHPQDLIFIVR